MKNVRIHLIFHFHSVKVCTFISIHCGAETIKCFKICWQLIQMQDNIILKWAYYYY
jgi:hypothetical protein